MKMRRASGRFFENAAFTRTVTRSVWPILLAKGRGVFFDGEPVFCVKAEVSRISPVKSLSISPGQTRHLDQMAGFPQDWRRSELARVRQQLEFAMALLMVRAWRTELLQVSQWTAGMA